MYGEPGNIFLNGSAKEREETEAWGRWGGTLRRLLLLFVDLYLTLVTLSAPQILAFSLCPPVFALSLGCA